MYHYKFSEFRNIIIKIPASIEYTIFNYIIIGPLTFNYDGQETLVGVVSWGVGCAVKHNPGVYARITHVLPWIEQGLAKTCDSFSYHTRIADMFPSI